MTTNHDPQDLSGWLETATRGLKPAVKATVWAEFEAHYADAVAEHMAQGLPEAEARRAALAGLGEAQATARALRDTYQAEKQYLAAAIVSLVFPIVFIWQIQGPHFPLLIEAPIYYAALFFPILYTLRTLNKLLVERFNFSQLTWPAAVTIWSAAVSTGSGLLIEISFDHIAVSEYYFASTAPWPEWGLGVITVASSCFLGLSLLWLGFSLWDVEDQIYGLKLPLSYSCCLCGMGLLGYVVTIVAAPDYVILTTLFTMLVYSFTCFLLTWIFFRATYRHLTPPARLA